MPLFELFRLTKAKLESSQETKPSLPEDEVVELVWENGQIATQSQSSKSSSPLPTLQSNSQVTKEFGNGSDAKMNGALSEIQVQVPVPSVDMGLGEDDDMLRWLGYPLYESLQETAYCSDFLPNVSEITANECENENDVPSQTAFPGFYGRDSGNQSLGNSHFVSACNDLSLGQGTSSNLPTKEAAISDSNLFQANSANPRVVCEGSSHTPASVGCFTHTQDPLLPNNKAGLINFSHFLRPAALAKANLRGMGAQSISKIGGADNRAAVTVSGSTPLETQPVELDNNRLREEKSSCYPFTASASKVGVAKQEEDKVFNESVASGLPNFVGMASSSENNQKACLSFGDTSRRDPESEKTVETLVACSSVCSGNNSLEGPSDDPSHGTKRKHSDTQDVECYSEDIEEESTDARKIAPSRVGSGSKRSRSAEVHNLSERRRRDRINEKMRALQELIPNCNKVDKASMLDEAIEYLKMLQVQVQIMSMGSGYYMPPIMLPLGMQHMHAAHIGHYPPMGINYGMGMPNMSGSLPRGPMVHVPPMPGSQFQGPMALHGRSESMFQPLRHHSQGVPVAMPHVGGGFFMSSPMEASSCGVVEPMKNMEATKESSLKEPEKSSVSQATQSSSGANIPTKQASDQVGRSI